MFNLEILEAKSAPNELVAINDLIFEHGFTDFIVVSDFPANQNRYEIVIEENPTKTNAPVLLYVDGAIGNPANLTSGSKISLNFAQPLTEYVIHSTGYMDNGDLSGSTSIRVWTGKFM